MDKELENKIYIEIGESITQTEAELLWYLRKNNDNAALITLRNGLKHLYKNHCDGIIKIQIKYSYTPKEIEFLEKIKGFSAEKLSAIKDYMTKLSQED
ncbi:MAG: hypothetical protein K2L70_01625 [Clostridia bacterium]|nr:hypothetical protein [Clostridia bacterium]